MKIRTFYALWRLIASDISSNVALDGNNGSKYTFAVPPCIKPRFGQYRPLSVPTGNIGNFNSCAKYNNPRRNVWWVPGLTRVPSGNIISVPPFIIFLQPCRPFCAYLYDRVCDLPATVQSAKMPIRKSVSTSIRV